MVLHGNPGVPGFFTRLGYDPTRETDAFACLERGDVDSCRKGLWSLVRGLELPGSEADSRLFCQLLLDILQKMNRRVHRGHDRQPGYQATRLRLIERFAQATQPARARNAFRRELQYLTDRQQGPSSRTTRLADRAKRFIEDHYDRRTSLSTVAAHLHVSSNYLSRVFRQETGLTLTAYIQRVRIGHARRMLADGRRSISEIAYRVGYRNYRDFYRNFVKYENASPRAVRERLHRAG
ncbi:MAG: helix-turn-helix domain-containing protein [Acidobacteria bacterium]|nr:helix-turn-helix domain-containing protein [Acidobacteriota bacterium]NIM62058.1 helix-turn-helix domain-containing protein [Acidobacteriota bacterium]NIO59707.1 helix-turn-helix domain-containing protein [Acidobacteriota bacterium]NIQ30796.1 helix-turn-helix domain-containing protein [Acidobacteriota bacterium]NIQ85858.1 helix-turn-helix domain-containing protein [Acidobacteriota bacterium]